MTRARLSRAGTGVPWGRTCATFTAGMVVIAVAGTATAQPRRTAHVTPATAHDGSRAAPGRSVGSPTEGHLIGGARLEESPWLRIVPCHRDEDVRWGLESLVAMIDRGARAVRREFPDSVLSVGHVSRRGGGEIDMHASHESGRDADLGFYIVNQQGKSIFAEHFVAFLGDGTAPTWPGAKFDDARNWALVSSLVTDPRAHVSHVFVATPLRTRLLTYAQRIGAPYATRVRASEVMAQPRAGLPHDDHFHVRISCPGGMEGCIEYPTRSVARVRRSLTHPRSHHEALGAPTPSAPPLPTFVVPERPSPTDDATHEPKAGRSRSHTSTDELPNAPVPSEAQVVPAPPPAVLDAPIDDVDGIEE